jgi:hypothetical protein
MAQQPNSGLDRPFTKVSESHAIRHTQRRILLNDWSARHRNRYVHNAQQIQQTGNHAVSRIRTRNPSNQETLERCLRQHDHGHRPAQPDEILTLSQAGAQSAIYWVHEWICIPWNHSEAPLSATPYFTHKYTFRSIPGTLRAREFEFSQSEQKRMGVLVLSLSYTWTCVKGEREREREHSDRGCQYSAD